MVKKINILFIKKKKKYLPENDASQQLPKGNPKHNKVAHPGHISAGAPPWKKDDKRSAKEHAIWRKNIQQAKKPHFSIGTI